MLKIQYAARWSRLQVVTAHQFAVKERHRFESNHSTYFLVNPWMSYPKKDKNPKTNVFKVATCNL